MCLSKIAIVACGILALHVSHVSAKCGVGFPIEAEEFFRINEACEILFNQHVNYANMNYVTFMGDAGVSEILSDETFFAKFGDKKYFVNKEVDEPRVVVKIVSLKQARPIKTTAGHGYQGNSTLFIQILPANDQKNDSSFSGRLSCLTVAEGDNRRSFKARFCAPESNAGRGQMKRFNSIIKNVQFE